MFTKLSDTELVTQFKAGCEESFLEILNRYSEKVHNLSMRLTRNPEDAEEIVQDVFVTVHTKIDSFKGESAFSSWLYRVTANTAFMKLRAKKSRAAISIEELGNSEKNTMIFENAQSLGEDSLSVQHEMRAVIEGAIAKLPEEYRAIFILRDVDGLSNQEVGEILNLSVPAVKSRLHRSRTILKKKLQHYYNDMVQDDYISFGSNSVDMLQ